MKSSTAGLWRLNRLKRRRYFALFCALRQKMLSISLPFRATSSRSSKSSRTLKSAANINLRFPSGNTHPIETFIGKTVKQFRVQDLANFTSGGCLIYFWHSSDAKQKRLFGYGIENSYTIDIVPTLRCRKWTWPWLQMMVAVILPGNRYSGLVFKSKN